MVVSESKTAEYVDCGKETDKNNRIREEGRVYPAYPEERYKEDRIPDGDKGKRTPFAYNAVIITLVIAILGQSLEKKRVRRIIKEKIPLRKSGGSKSPPFEKGGSGGIYSLVHPQQIPLNPPFSKGDFKSSTGVQNQ